MSVVAALTKDGLIPDVFPAAFTPKYELHVAYKSGVKADNGNVLTPTLVKDQPNLTWTADPTKLYSLFFVDPDAPTRSDPKNGQWFHWFVANIPGTDISKGDLVKAYVGSGPPPNSGLHRYVYALYEHTHKVDVSDVHVEPNTSAKHRAHFNLDKFVAAKNLGSPVAVNFYQAEFDDYVPQLYKQFTH